MATKKAITEEQLRAANKAGYSTQQIAGEINQYEKRTGNDAVFAPTYKGPAEGTAENNAIAQGKPIQQAVQAQTMQPIVQTPNPNMIDTNTGKPVSESSENAQYNILPENVTGVKVSPTLQAKIDAKKNGTPAVVPTEVAPVENKPVETAAETPLTEVKTETVTTPTEVKTEVTDIEKQAQATGVAYTMQNGQATYNPKTTEEAAKILAMGGKLQGESKMTAVAQASLNKVRGLGQMTDQQLANNIAGGQVSNKELELLNTMNPQLVAQAKELSKKKIITNTTNEIQADNSMIIKGEEPTGMSKPLQDLVNKLATIDADTKSPAEMKTAYQDAHPEMIQSRDQINELTKQKRDLQLAKMKMWDEIKAKQSSLPISMIMGAYSAMSRDLDNQIYLINDDLNTEISNYNMYLDDMNAEIDFEIGQQGKEEERLFQMYGVTRAEEIREEDLIRADQEFTAQMEQARSEAEYNQIKDERDYNFKIWETEYGMKKDERDYGLKVSELDYNRAKDERDYGFKVADAENAFNLKVAEMNQKGQGNWKEDSLGNLYNDTTGERMTREQIVNPGTTGSTQATNEDGGFDLSFAPDTFSGRTKATLNIKVKKDADGIQLSLPEGSIAGQCAFFVNDYAKKLPGYKWSVDSWKSKQDNINSKVPVAGGLFMYTPGKNEPYGHIGIVEKVFKDGSFQIYDSNYVGPNKTDRRVIQKGSKEWKLLMENGNNGGFFAPQGSNPQAQAEPQKAYNDTDISIFNSITATEKKKLQNNPQYEQFITDYNSVMRNKNASIEDILRYSAGFKTIGDKEGERLVKFEQALSQVYDMEKQIDKMRTGPILGRLRDLNPYDTDAQTLKAELQALIPNLARGVYGEVGVLTDQDIINYAKTLPNLKATNDVNDAVLAMTLKVLANGYKKQLQSLASGKNDVSGFEGTYYQYMDRVNEIERRLGINTSLSQEDELEALSIR